MSWLLVLQGHLPPWYFDLYSSQNIPVFSSSKVNDQLRLILISTHVTQVVTKQTNVCHSSPYKTDAQPSIWPIYSLWCTDLCDHTWSHVSVNSQEKWIKFLFREVSGQLFIICVHPIWLISSLTLYVLNFSEGTKTYIYILCHSSTLTWPR